MNDYFTTIRHQQAVRQLGTCDLYLRTVYSHLLGYTAAQGSWHGTLRDLSAQIEISASKACRAVNQLIQSGLVRRLEPNRYIALSGNTANSSKGTAADCNNDTATVNNDIANSNKYVADDNKHVAHSNNAVADGNPPNPLFNKDNREETRTRTRDAPEPLTDSFPDFCNAYRARGGKFTPQQHTDCYALWSQVSDAKRAAIMAELARPDGFWRPRADWLLADYQLPPPKNYNGSSEFAEAIKTIPLVTAAYNGVYGIYSLSDAQKYGMQIKHRMN